MGDIVGEDVEISKREISRVRKRVLNAEKEKLDLKYPRGINQDIESLIREEVD